MPNLCQYCDGRLQPIGHDRLNGRDHPDWPTRKYHKKCWKEIYNSDYDSYSDHNRLSKIDGMSCCYSGCLESDDCMCKACIECGVRHHKEYLDLRDGMCMRCDIDNFMRKEGRFICRQPVTDTIVDDHKNE